MFLTLLEQHIHHGTLNVRLPTGECHRFGEGGTEVNWVINSERALAAIARDWELQLGETYMAGDWSAEGCELRELLTVLRSNFRGYTVNRWLRPLLQLRQQWNRVAHSYRNAARHYDLEEDFFRLFLDEDMHYSCAYFATEHCSLDQAQQAKCALIADKLLLEPGQRVLDIGCGWGSLAMYLARHFGVEVVGITLSREQLASAQRRAEACGLSSVRFALEDYREHRGQYDRIVSVGMFEHVGSPCYRDYFDCVGRLLAPDGVALLHSIGRTGPPGTTNPWIRRHIFPGGYIPAQSEVCAAIEPSGLLITDVEILRLHYAKTLRAWGQRFAAHRDEVQRRHGEAFCRMWEFYLSSCEAAFRCGELMVMHMQLAKQQDAVPITRDYLLDSVPLLHVEESSGVQTRHCHHA